MRIVRIHADAAEEAESAAAWYEREQPGLGADFENAVDTALDLLETEAIPATSMTGVAGTRPARRLVLRRFPYDIVFVERPGNVWVIAFAHHSRRPAYWQERVRAQQP